MFQNQSEHYWCILFQLNKPDGIKYVQSHYIVVMRIKYSRPLSKPKSVPLSYSESKAEQTYLLLFTLTKGNVQHCIPGEEISQIKWYFTWDALITFIKYQFPAAREDSSVLQKQSVTCKVLLQSPQLPSHSGTKVSETDFDPAPLVAKAKSDEGILQNPLQKESLRQSHVEGREPNNLIPFLSSVRFWFSVESPQQSCWNKTLITNVNRESSSQARVEAAGTGCFQWKVFHEEH